MATYRGSQSQLVRTRNRCGRGKLRVGSRRGHGPGGLFVVARIEYVYMYTYVQLLTNWQLRWQLLGDSIRELIAYVRCYVVGERIEEAMQVLYRKCHPCSEPSHGEGGKVCGPDCSCRASETRQAALPQGRNARFREPPSASNCEYRTERATPGWLKTTVHTAPARGHRGSTSLRHGSTADASRDQRGSCG